MGAPLAPGTVLNGRFTIDTPIQVGRDGTLYRGSDVLAAAKLVWIRECSDPSPAGRDRFQEEAKILAGLEHPSLPVVLDSFVEPSGLPYLVLLGYGQPHLGAELAQKGAFVEGQVLAWFGRLLDAVEYLHAQRPPIIHGHISPAQIVITADGTPHLLGLADVEEAANADAPEAHYLAPEQRIGAVDERSDVYGLGATLYALLTGKPPADAGARAGGAELVPPRQLSRAISPGVEAAILKALALDPGQRYISAGQLWQALAEAGQAGPFGPQAVAEQPHPGRRRRTVALAGGGTLAVVVLGAIAARMLLPAGGEASPTPFSPSAPAVLPSATVEASATPMPTGTAPRPPATSVAIARPTATSTPTAQPTPTPRPTQPAVQRPTAAAPTPTARWYPGPAATNTPRWFPAPALAYPNEGAVLTGSVEFRWTWPYTLADDEYFDLQVYRIGMEPKGIAWCKEPSFRTIGLLLGEGQYEWRVQVIRGQAGQVLGYVSDRSEARGLTWRAGRPATPTP